MRAWRWLVVVALLVAASRGVSAETYRHDLYGVAVRIPAGFTANADLARSRSGVLAAWTGEIGSAFAVLILEHADAVASATADDAAAKRIVNDSLINAQCDTIEREKLSWRGRTLGVIVGFVKGDVEREAHAVVDVPLIGGGALRIRLSTTAARRQALSKALRALVATVTVRKP